MQTKRTFFVTAICANRNPIFRDENLARLFLEIFFDYQKQEKYLIRAFVVMPDHVHAIITPAEVVSLEKAMQFIKGGSSFRLGNILPAKTEIWQRGFTPPRIDGPDDFFQHVEYVHQNPVRAKLVKKQEEYLYSSVHHGFVLDAAPFGRRG
jgi:putative transposase